MVGRVLDTYSDNITCCDERQVVRSEWVKDLTEVFTLALQSAKAEAWQEAMMAALEWGDGPEVYRPKNPYTQEDKKT